VRVFQHGRSHPIDASALGSVKMSEHPPPQIAHWPVGAVFTLGHSTLPIERFLAVLQVYGIERLVDIRTVPRSRHNPQFNDTALAQRLAAEHLEYVPMQALGGWRHARKDSPNTGWRNEAFRGYADYMQTAPFQEALEALIHMGREQRVAIMCAEAVPDARAHAVCAGARIANYLSAEASDLVIGFRTTAHSQIE
jgi:uncharacterized protein (DUF488 family)